jgi:polyketide-type polyunsaturated fatty acid synthase PfaA
MSSQDRPRQEPIAIVGVSALIPGATTMAECWRTMVEGHDLVRDVPPGHWLLEDHFDENPSAPDKTYGRRGAFLDPIEFDPLEFGIPPSALPATDTTQLLALVAARRLLEDVERCGAAEADGERVGIILGASALELLTTMAHRLQRPIWEKALRASGLPDDEARRICDRIVAHYVPWQEATFPGLLTNVVAGRVANHFDLHGANFTTDAACASSLAAVLAAVDELSLQRADMMITGGVDTLNDPLMFTCFSKTPALSPTGDCRPFAVGSDGTTLGEGVIMFALRRLADAERDGNAIYAVIRGVGASSDGRGTAVYAPAPAGQARALRRAYEAAGYGPDTVELLEAHGTGTPAGDAAEVTALRQVFAAERPPGDRPWCALGSIKSQIGHTKAAAGAAGLLKAVLAVHHGVLPPTIKADQPNPRLRLDDGPFRLNTAARPWVRDSAHPRRASVSSAGFGGSNFHVTIEEYRPRDAGRRPRRLQISPSELVPLTASSAHELLSRCRALLDDGQPFHQIVRQAQQSFDQIPVRSEAEERRDFRLALVATGLDDLRTKAGDAAARIAAAPEEAFSAAGVHYGQGETHGGQMAFVFPGQGSQYVGMGADLAMHRLEARSVWDRATDVTGDRPLHRVVFPFPAYGDQEREQQTNLLTATEWAQPAIAVHSMALLSVLTGLRLRADCVAGHSMGELTALHAAGVLDAGALVRLTRRRGELMSAAAGRGVGGMLAVTADKERVRNVIEALGARDLWPVNDNAPQQIVVAGGSEAVAALQEALTSEGIEALRLSVSAAFHSPLIKDVPEPLLEFASTLEFRSPRCPVYGNIDARPYPPEADAIRRRLARQTVSPVRFADQIQAMYGMGVRTFVEVGPSSVLTGLVRANLAGRPHLAVCLDRQGVHGMTALYEGLARLIAHGARPYLRGLWDAHELPAPARIGSPATVLICGTNYGKPYPANGQDDVLSTPAGPMAGPPDSTRPSVLTSEVTSLMPRVPESPDLISPSSNGAARLNALQELQRLAAETQAAYHHAMSETQARFLSLAERTLGHLEGEGSPPDNRQTAQEIAANGAAAAVDLLAPVPNIAPRPATASRPESSPMPEHPPTREAEPWAGPPDDPDESRIPQQPATSAAPPDAPQAGTPDLATLVLEIVADKTGYPADILTPEMQLQSDLGIDSIKRVEVLSALRERVPDLPSLDTATLGRLQTLGEVTERLRDAHRAADGGHGGLSTRSPS